MKHIVAFSGGKDSLATLLWVIEKYGVSHLEVVFCDTGWEAKETYDHIAEIEKTLGIDFIKLKSKKYDSFYDLSMKKKRVASTMARFCTTELKVIPMIDYILDKKENLIVYQGIRADESKSRSTMDAQCTYFKFYTQRKANGKYEGYRRKDVLAWLERYNADIIRPIFEWKANDVFDYIKAKGLRANPLYYEGFTRVGCFPCIMCRHGEIELLTRKHPERIEAIQKLEDDLGRTFFPPGYIPDRFCTRSDDKGNVFPSVSDVTTYLTKKFEADPTLFDMNEPTPSCESIYNICE